MKNETKWQLVRTRPKAEKRVCELLAKKNIKHFCPANTTKHYTQQDKFKILKQPLFQQLVFVQVENGAESLVQQIDGVQHFIYWLGEPALITNAEVEMIRIYTSTHTNVQVEKIVVNAGKMATMVYSSERQGVEEGTGISKDLCRMQLPSLGYALVAEVVNPEVEILNVRRSERYGFASLFTGSFR